MRNYYKSGDWNAICDRCGFRFKASSLKKDWQGLMVCEEDFERRHPMDFLKVTPDKIAVPWTRSEPTTATNILQDNFGLGTEYLGYSYIGRP